MKLLVIVFSSSLLILVLIGVRALLKRRADPRLIYALWLLVLLRLLLPLELGAVPFSVSSLLSQRTPETVIVDGEAVAVIGGADGPTTILVTGPQGHSVFSIDGSSAIPPLPPWLTLRVLLFSLWLLGALIVLTVQIVANVRLSCRLKQQAVPEHADGPSSYILHVCGKTYRRIPPLYWADFLPSPCLFGLLKPRIYLHHSLTEKERFYILAHETTHWQHGDNWWALLRLICLSLHWFNPLVWWAAALSRHDAELACDAAVLARATQEERREYGETLLSLLTEQKPDWFSAATKLSGKETGAAKRRKRGS